MGYPDISESDRLALRAVALLTGAFARDFGLTLRIGAEQEYFCADPRRPHETDPLGLADDPEHQPAYYERMGSIRRHYKEAGFQKYELVLDHEQYHDPAAVCRGVMARREGLARRAAAAGLALSFEGVHPTGDTSAPFHTAGLQYVLSFTRADGSPLFPPAPRVQSLRRLHACNMALGVMSPYTLLAVGSAASFGRFGTDYYGSPPGGFVTYDPWANGRQEAPALWWRNTHDAFEFRLPSADASPPQAMLMLLAGWYEAFRRDPDLLDPAARAFGMDGRGTKVVHAGPVAPDGPSALAEFAEADVISGLLDRLAPGERLGSRWHAATAAEYAALLEPKAAAQGKARSR